MNPGYSRGWRTFAALGVVVALAASPVEGAAGGASPPKAKAKRCEIVVFKRKGKTIRRCRLKRAAKPVPRPASSPTPSPIAVGMPQPTTTPEGPPALPVPGPGPTTPPAEERPAPTARDPWFLTLHARDVGNGDFRLTPAIGSIPAGTLYLSLKNDDAGEHDLRLRGLAPERPEQLIFPASSTEELRETELRLDPGRYEFRCGLLGHEQMRQEFVVDA